MGAVGGTYSVGSSRLYRAYGAASARIRRGRMRQFHAMRGGGAGVKGKGNRASVAVSNDMGPQGFSST